MKFATWFHGCDGLEGLGGGAAVAAASQSLMREYDLLRADGPSLTLGEPRCVVIAGDASRELRDQHRRESFELLRERLNGVIVVTYDELFQRLRRLLELLESPAGGAG